MRLVSARIVRCAAALLAASVPLSVGAQPSASTGDPSSPAASTPANDLGKKAEILRSSRWRRAVFELGEWLDSQEIYQPKQVMKIKSDFNQRVAKMTSYELEYLLEDLEAKFKVMDSPEAKDARAWVGQYLSTMSDRKREEVLKDIPDVVKMSSGELSREIQKIEATRQSLQQRQAAFDQGRQQLIDQAQAARQATAQAAAAATAQANSAPAYSPYRGQGGGKPPFSDSQGGGMSIGVGPWGAYVGFNVGNF